MNSRSHLHYLQQLQQQPRLLYDHPTADPKGKLPVIIGLGGASGVGKGEISAQLAAAFRIKPENIVSAGNLFRRLAVERGVSFEELGRQASVDGGVIDQLVDEATLRATEDLSQELIIAEGRLVPWLLYCYAQRRSVRICINVANHTRFERITARENELLQRKNAPPTDVASVAEATRKREQDYTFRYARYYDKEAEAYLDPRYFTHFVSNEGPKGEAFAEIMRILT